MRESPTSGIEEGGGSLPRGMETVKSVNRGWCHCGVAQHTPGARHVYVSAANKFIPLFSPAIVPRLGGSPHSAVKTLPKNDTPSSDEYSMLEKNSPQRRSCGGRSRPWESQTRKTEISAAASTDSFAVPVNERGAITVLRCNPADEQQQERDTESGSEVEHRPIFLLVDNIQRFVDAVR